MRIEWTQHLFSHWVAWFPFAEHAPYQPDFARLPEYPVDTYLNSLDRRGVDGGVLVQPEPYGQDHRLLLYALALEPKRFRAACLFLPDDPAAPEKLEQMVCAEPRIIAQRFHAFRSREPYFADWDDQQVRQLWKRAGELGLVIELHISPEQAAQVAGTINVMSAYPVVIDHLAEPGFGSEAEYQGVLALARFPYVWIKLSALSRIEQEIGGRDRLKNLISRLVGVYGPQRLVWGGGDLDYLDELLVGLSTQERDQIKGTNLARLLHWEVIDGKAAI